MQSPPTKTGVYKWHQGFCSNFLLKSVITEKLHFLNCHCLKLCLGSKTQVAHSVFNKKVRMNMRKGFQTSTVDL